MTTPIQSRLDARAPAYLTNVHTAWNPPWLISAMAEHGLRYAAKGTPIQDAHRLAIIGPHVVLIVADGVGSSSISQLGSDTAASAALAHLSSTLTAEPPNPNHVTLSLAAAHAAINDLATRTARSPDAYATTLLVAVLTGSHIAAASIGDSSILTYAGAAHAKQRKLTPFLSTPTSGNNTYSIHDPNWRLVAHARAEQYPNLKGVLLTTDGGNSFFTTDATLPILKPLSTKAMDAVDTFLRSNSARDLYLFWSFYLQRHPSVEFDDRTILLAIKPDAPLTFPQP